MCSHTLLYFHEYVHICRNHPRGHDRSIHMGEGIQNINRTFHVHCCCYRTLAGGAGFPVRHMAEGAFTCFDIILIFITATLFMNLLKHSGGVSFIHRRILSRFYRKKTILFVLITFLYYALSAYIAFIIIWNLLKSRNGRMNSMGFLIAK
jgi:hypothetical protein